MSTEYQIKGIDLSGFESFGDVKIVKGYEEIVIEFSSPSGCNTCVNKVIYNDHGNRRVTLRRLGKDTNENDIRYLLFLVMCITGKGVMSDDYGFEMGFMRDQYDTRDEYKFNNDYEEVTERNKSFYDLDIQDQYEYMLSQMSESDRFLELDRFELSELTLVKYIQKFYPEMLVVKTRGYRTREEELKMFNEHSSRYDGLYEDIDGNFVTSKEELEFREKTLKVINEFWDEFESQKQTDYIIYKI